MSRKKKWTDRKKLRAAAARQLHRMLAVGESRHLAKLAGTASLHIYSYETYHTYLRVVLRFMDHCSAAYRVTSPEACRPYAVPWLSARVGKVSVMTLAKERSALRKFFQEAEPPRPKLPPFRVTDVTLNRNPASWASFPARRHEELVRFCLATGLRRRELYLLRGTDLEVYQGVPCIAVNRGAKGGRQRLAEIRGNPAAVQLILDLMHRAGAGKVFPHVPGNAPIHHYRALYAVQVYLHYAKSYEECRTRTFWNKDRYTAMGQPPGALQSRVYRYRRPDRQDCWLDKAAMRKTALNLGHGRISVFARSYEYPLFQQITSPYEEHLLELNGLEQGDLTQAGQRFRFPGAQQKAPATRQGLPKP